MGFSGDETFSFSFCVSMKDMDIFKGLSGDSSRIHVDNRFARTNGFKDVLVYGSIIAAQVSRFVGMGLGRDDTMEIGLTIDFLSPLYVDEPATFSAGIKYISESTATAGFEFRIITRDRSVAKGHVLVMFLRSRPLVNSV
jgi:acyl dehydratase